MPALAGFTIPNEADAGHADQAELHEFDVQALAAGFNLTGVLSGCAVTAQGTPDQTVAVAAGVVIIEGKRVAVTAGNVSMAAADATNPRYDLVTVDKSGVKGKVDGTAAANPKKPDYPDDKVVLAEIRRAANDNAIASGEIVPKGLVLAHVAMGAPAATGRWYRPAYIKDAVDAVPLTLGDMTAVRIHLEAGTLDRIAAHHFSTAGGAGEVQRLGIYNDDNGRPGSLLLDAGTIDLTTGNAFKAITISQAVSDAWYWLASVRQGTTNTAHMVGYGTDDQHQSLMDWQEFDGTAIHDKGLWIARTTGVTGALPNPYGTITMERSHQQPMVAVRYA